MKDGATKDELRIQSLINKSKGDKEKEIMYATNMAKAINKPDKAHGRAVAALDLLGVDNPITTIFLDRAKELGYAVEIEDALEQELVDAGVMDQADIVENETIYLPTTSSIAIWKAVIKDIIRNKAAYRRRHIRSYRDYHNRPTTHWADLNVAIGAPKTFSSEISSNDRTVNVLRGIRKHGYENELLNAGKFGRAVGQEVLTTQYRSIETDVTYTEKDLDKDLSFIKQAMNNIKSI